MPKSPLAPELTDAQVNALRKRFNEKVIPNPATGCWLWAGAKTGATNDGRGGYAELAFGDMVLYAHRLAFRLAHGRWPKGPTHHTCRTRFCVQPLHLVEIGDHASHMREHARIRRTRGKVQVFPVVAPAKPAA